MQICCIFELFFQLIAHVFVAYYEGQVNSLVGLYEQLLERAGTLLLNFVEM